MITTEQWAIGLALLNDPRDFDRLRARITPAGPAVTALLINLGVI